MNLKMCWPKEKTLTNYSEVNSLIFLSHHWYFQNYSLCVLPPTQFCSLPERFSIPINLGGQTVPAERCWGALEFCRREASSHLHFYPLYKPVEQRRTPKPVRPVGSLFPIRSSFHSTVFKHLCALVLLNY